MNELIGRSCAELERLWREAPLGPLPTGRWVGRHLGFLNTEGARRFDVRMFDTALFVWPTWGIDVDRRLWWFIDPRLAAGRFRAAARRGA